MKLKKILAVTSVLAVFGASIPCENFNVLNDFTVSVSAETLENGLVYSVNSDETEIYISDYIGGGGVVTIPIEIQVEIDGNVDILPVTSIELEKLEIPVSIIIPSGSYITKIGTGAFAHSKLVSITIPDSVKHIGQQAFWGCDLLKSVSLPNTIKNIDGHTFMNCIALESIIIPDSVTNIGDFAFCGCTSLTEITIPDSVAIIGCKAFSGCTSLTSVTIPDSVTNIGERAFDGCELLTDIYFQGTEEEWNSIDIYEYNDCLLNANIHFLGENGEPSVTTTETTTSPITNTETTTIITSEKVSGDANLDGEIDVRDVTYINQYIIKAIDLTEESLVNADIIKDGVVDISDLGQMKKYILKLIDTL